MKTKDLERLRLEITKVVMRRHFFDAFLDIAQLILDIEALFIAESLAKKPAKKKRK